MFSKQTEDIAQQLKSSKQTVAVAESSAGGLIAANLLAVEGASEYFVGGSVIYTLASWQAFLELDFDQVKSQEPLSEAMALTFAEAAQRKLSATWTIAELGAAGPSGSRYGHDAGTCVIAVTGPITLQRTVLTHSNDRQANMLAFTEAALSLLAEALQKSA